MAFSIDIDASAPAPRLTSRRGSLSAPDPFARNASLDTPRGLTSRLTIVRVPALPESSSGEDAAALQKSRVRAHTSASAGRWGHARTGSDTSDGRKERMSFAFSSFYPAKTDEPTSTSSPGSSPPRSPFRPITAKDRTHSNPSLPARGFSAFQTRRPSLSPDQVCELARATIAQAAHEGASDPASPRSALFPPEPESPSAGALPTPFTPLPESHYLPFIDRPSEVRALLSSDANKRFMALLKQTFPAHLRDAPGGAPADQNPTEWSFPALARFLFECPRAAVPDRAWVPRVRRCIRARSEAVWERFKNVLGVPPELDADEELEDEEEGAEDALELDDAWVEPVFPSRSPRVTSISPVDMDEGLGFRPGSMMETIGEGEEEESVPTVTPASANSDGDEPEPAPERIRALLLCTRTSFSAGHSPPPVPLPADAPDTPRSFSQRRRSVDRPEFEFERGPGNPLFPSNFGRLSIGPTLAANNPHSIAPLPSAYAMPRRHTHTAGTLQPPDAMLRRWGSDCAVTFASGSSDRGSVGGE